MPLRIFLIALLILVQATAWSQSDIFINASFKNVTLTEVLNTWRRDYNVDFAFDSYELSKYRTSLEFQDVTLERALASLLTDTPFTFQRMDGTLVIYPIAKVSPIADVLAKNSQVITGTVMDALSGETLPFAVVALLRSGTGATCDEFGNFSLNTAESAIPDTLIAAYVGYATALWPLNALTADQPVQLNLVPQANILGDVKVEDRKNQLYPRAAALPGIFLKPDDIQMRYGLGEPDLLRIAQLQAGVAGSLETSNGLVLRGGASDQSLLLMDGFTIYHQDHFFGLFSSINSYAVKAMRLQKGIADVELGGRASGALELWGREGDLRKASGRIECGTLSISGAVEAPLDSSGKASVFICGRRSLTEMFQSRAYRELFNTLYSGAIAYGGNTKLDAFNLNFKPAVQFQDINAKLTYHPGSKTRIHLSLYASRDDMDFAYADTSDSQLLDVTDVRYNDETNKMNRGLSLRWQQRYSDRLQSNTMVGFSLFEGNYFSTDSITNNLFLLDTNQFSAREISLRDWSLKHHWLWNQHMHEWKVGIALNSIQTTDRLRSSLLLNQSDQNKGNVITVFGGDTWRANERWSLQLGSRLNYFMERRMFYSEPRLVLTKMAFADRLALRLTATQSFQYIQRISSQNLYQNTPDVWRPATEHIPVLRARQLSIGGLWSVKQFSLEVEAYRKWNEGQVTNAQSFELNAGASGEMTTVVGNADIIGMDAQMNWKWQNHAVILAYGWMHARANYPDIAAANIRESYYRNHELKVNYSWRRRGWSFSLLEVMTDGAPYTALAGFYSLNLPGDMDRILPIPGGANAAQTPWYVRTDVVAAYEWTWGSNRLALQGAIYNLLNRTNTRGVQYTVVPTNQNPEGFRIIERSVLMIGRIPSIHLSWQF
jgi:hypothetical protein